ncbi:FAD-dependent oxidoreductase [Massilia sp. PAMC28688]|uniref:GMC family oxidoreductase N-terminal domain-containing protein n=1 Tax=Massilia sp. PAMC28688 TaxID=2861283 RepID=UPI001C6267CD|nr:GMC family oxidoreductase N-terminal domain-containing protein [Massilia sp. PAMC28688]QYF93477.1 FAD-dependent oxidoreductase [Massilia sp. PAMC28688]
MSAVLAPEAAPEYDAIVVGSGAGGATVARELARRGKQVLLLERGADSVPRDGLLYMARVSDFAPVAEGVSMARAITTGGTTSLYFGVAEYPSLPAFRAMGIELGPAFEEARRELPMVEPLSDRLLSAQVRAVEASARGIGLPWMKTESMMIDESKVRGGFTHEAIWRARSYVEEAVRLGATLVNRATVRKVLVEGGRAVGVEYELRLGRRRELRRAYGERVIMAAGAVATPQILRDSGVGGVGDQGFYCDPGFLLIGHVDGVRGGDLFPGCMGTNSEEGGIMVGDGCLPRSMYRGYMLANGKIANLFRHRKHVALGVMIRDGMGGELRADGRLHKEFTREDMQKLDKGGELAEQIMAKAGAKGVIRSDLSAAHVGGLLQIGRHLDASLQTEVGNLHVCDCSVLPANVRLTPVFTLVCLGKYLAAQLAPVQ